MHGWVRDLFPICRSLTGDGVRQTLAYLGYILKDLSVHEVPTGTVAFDWTVPNSRTAGRNSVRHLVLLTPLGLLSDASPARITRAWQIPRGHRRHPGAGKPHLWRADPAGTREQGSSSFDIHLSSVDGEQ